MQILNSKTETIEQRAQEFRKSPTGISTSCTGTILQTNHDPTTRAGFSLQLDKKDPTLKRLSAASKGLTI